MTTEVPEDVRVGIERLLKNGAPADGLAKWEADELLAEIRRLREKLERLRDAKWV